MNREINSRIFQGNVIHSRYLPVKHRFSYRLFMVSLDLDEIETVFNPYFGWSSLKPSLAWFKSSDHLINYKKYKTLKQDLVEMVYDETGKRSEGRVTLLTHLRYFNYVMNPVSFYFCWDKQNKFVEAIVAEINNTPWGEQHLYVLSNDSPGKQDQLFEFDKSFHVSPFMDMKQKYIWYFRCNNESIKISMKTIEENRTLFWAGMTLTSLPITQRNLNKVLIHYPLMTLKVITAIYWQAFRLWLKRTPFFEHPKHYLTRRTHP